MGSKENPHERDNRKQDDEQKRSDTVKGLKFAFLIADRLQTPPPDPTLMKKSQWSMLGFALNFMLCPLLELSFYFNYNYRKFMISGSPKKLLYLES